MKIDQKMIFALSEPLALVPKPYEVVARRLKMPEVELLSKISEYKKTGIIRRVGVVLGHLKVGYKCNALVMWQVDESRLEAAGKVFASFAQVTHCYARQTYPSWPYNLYTMVHARSKVESRALIKAMSEKSGVKTYKIQFTVKEFKKIKSDLKEILS